MHGTSAAVQRFLFSAEPAASPPNRPFMPLLMEPLALARFPRRLWSCVLWFRLCCLVSGVVGQARCSWMSAASHICWCRLSSLFCQSLLRCLRAVGDSKTKNPARGGKTCVVLSNMLSSVELSSVAARRIGQRHPCGHVLLCQPNPTRLVSRCRLNVLPECVRLGGDGDVRREVSVEWHWRELVCSRVRSVWVVWFGNHTSRILHVPKTSIHRVLRSPSWRF